MLHYYHYQDILELQLLVSKYPVIHNTDIKNYHNFHADMMLKLIFLYTLNPYHLDLFLFHNLEYTHHNYPLYTQLNMTAHLYYTNIVG